MGLRIARMQRSGFEKMDACHAAFQRSRKLQGVVLPFTLCSYSHETSICFTVA